MVHASSFMDLNEYYQIVTQIWKNPFAYVFIEVIKREVF
jgi:hypothetical protein